MTSFPTLVENRWRTYIPTLGIYTSPDPEHRASVMSGMGPQAYAYASGRPLLLADPDGRLGRFATMDEAAATAAFFILRDAVPRDCEGCTTVYEDSNTSCDGEGKYDYTGIDFGPRVSRVGGTVSGSCGARAPPAGRVAIATVHNHISNDPTPSWWGTGYNESDVFQAALASPPIKYIYVATAPGTAHKWTYNDASGPPISLGSFSVTRGY